MMLIETTTPAVVYGDTGELHVVVQLPDGVHPGERVDVLACGYFHAPVSGDGPVLYEPPAQTLGDPSC